MAILLAFFIFSQSAIIISAAKKPEEKNIHGNRGEIHSGMQWQHVSTKTKVDPKNKKPLQDKTKQVPEAAKTQLSQTAQTPVFNLEKTRTKLLNMADRLEKHFQNGREKILDAAKIPQESKERLIKAIDDHLAELAKLRLAITDAPDYETLKTAAQKIHEMIGLTQAQVKEEAAKHLKKPDISGIKPVPPFFKSTIEKISTALPNMVLLIQNLFVFPAPMTVNTVNAENH